MDLGEVHVLQEVAFLQLFLKLLSQQASRRRRRLESQAAKASGKEARRIREEIDELSDTDNEHDSSDSEDGYDYAWESDDDEMRNPTVQDSAQKRAAENAHGDMPVSKNEDFT